MLCLGGTPGKVYEPRMEGGAVSVEDALPLYHVRERRSVRVAGAVPTIAVRIFVLEESDFR